MRKSDVFLIVILVIAGLFFYQKYDQKKNKEFSADEQNTNLKIKPAENDSLGKQIEKRQQDQMQILVDRQNAITNSIQEIHPAVVSVNVIKTEIIRRYMNPFENPFFGFFDNVPYKREVQGIGSGVIFTDDGYLITNAHVVEGATQIKIMLSDERQFEGTIIGTDSVHDIAVLKIEGKNLPSAKLGSSDDLIIGEWAIAVGNPYGLLLKDSKPSVSVGVISAIDRNFAENKDGKIYRKMIQTDAAINPGNSGGPLVNIYGEVVGINTFIFSESGGSIGIGFAIPVDRVKQIASELIKYGKVRDIWFGFKVQDINPMLASYMNLSSTDGVLVSVVDKNGPAEKAGLQKSDIIIEINGIKIINSNDAELAVSDIAVGDYLRLKILRGKEKLTINIKTVEYK